jgi:hypothetical protein
MADEKGKLSWIRRVPVGVVTILDWLVGVAERFG